MKTKELIAMLQKEDPTGEGHIRMDGGIPWFCESKAGYWDGPYEYIDEDGNFVTSTKDYKVDIRCLDVEDYVENNVNIHDKDNWEKIKNKFKFDLTYSSSQERIDSKLKRVKEHYDLCVQLDNQFLKESTDEAVQHYKDGWKFYQEIDSKLEYHRWLIVQPDGKDNNGSSSQHDTNGIINSGLFERLDNNQVKGYYEWILK